MKNLVLLLGILLSGAVTSNAQPTTGLKAYWRMDGNFNDSTSNAINGTNNGATATTNNLSVVNKAMSFNNPTSTPTQFATHPSNSNLNFGTNQDFSIDFSIYLTGPFAHNSGFYDNNLNYGGYGGWFWTANGFLQLNFNVKNGNTQTINGTFAVDTWYKICCVRSGSAVLIYVNGVLNKTGATGTTAPTYNFSARFGSMFYDAQTPKEYNPMHGKLDEMRIYNRALTQAEITQLYNVWQSPPVVPVKLSQFTATKLPNAVALNWQTEIEQNSRSFIIEKSTDGFTFFTVGNIAAKGNSSNTVQYSFNDISFLSPTIFYRLKMEDQDGKFEYSKIVRLNNENKSAILIYPNPTKDAFVLSSLNNELINSHALLIDAEGKIIKEFVITATTQTVDINNLVPGTYSIKLANGQIQKIIKQH